jgi:hypothetical protein
MAEARRRDGGQRRGRIEHLPGRWGFPERIELFAVGVTAPRRPRARAWPPAVAYARGVSMKPARLHSRSIGVSAVVGFALRDKQEPKGHSR